MVRAERGARPGFGSSRPSSKRIMKVDPCRRVLLESIENRGCIVSAGPSTAGRSRRSPLPRRACALRSRALRASSRRRNVRHPARGEVASEPHGDGAGGDLGETGKHDDARRSHGAGESGRESKGDGQTIGEPDDDIANSRSWTRSVLQRAAAEAGMRREEAVPSDGLAYSVMAGSVDRWAQMILTEV